MSLKFFDFLRFFRMEKSGIREKIYLFLFFQLASEANSIILYGKYVI
jgi:hypothetical protein